MTDSVTLTNTMEDYLEAISVLGERKEYIRVKDIAKYMKVKMPTVNSAIKSLVKRELVAHEKYEYVKLTNQGTEIADNIRRRHYAMLSFLTDVLKMDPKKAEENACQMEHGVDPETIERILRLIECMKSCPGGIPECLNRFDEYMKTGKMPEVTVCKGVDELKKESDTVLRSLKPGTKAKVIRLSGTGAVRRRIMDMGVVPGTTVEVENVAPLGDPIEVKVKGYHLSLRKEEAADIYVEVI